MVVAHSSLHNSASGKDAKEYVCWCSKVTEQDIARAILEKGAGSVNEVIKLTGAMRNCNCAVLNPKGV